MPTMSFSELLPELNIQIPNVPEPLALSRLAKAAREFCLRSLVWERSVMISLLNEQACYELRLPRETEIAAVVRATLNERELTAKAPDQLAQTNPRWAAAAGDPRHYYLTDYTDLHVNPIPDRSDAGNLCVTLALMPRKDAETIDEDIARRWEDAIVTGAQAALHAMPAKDWTLFEAVPALRQSYEYSVALARVQRRQGDAVGTIQANRQPLV